MTQPNTVECEELIITLLKFVLWQGGETALMWAAHNGHSNTCKLLLESGANIDLQDDVSTFCNCNHLVGCVLATGGVELKGHCVFCNKKR